MKTLEASLYDGEVSPCPAGTAGRSMVILRDTGAAQSLMVPGDLALPPDSSENAKVLIQGIGPNFMSVPLHKVDLKCDLVSGPVTVGVVPELLMEGVDFLLGNDLAGDRVVASPVVSDKPLEVAETELLQEDFPGIFPDCVVTRSQTRRAEKDDAESADVEESIDVWLAETFFKDLNRDIVEALLLTMIPVLAAPNFTKPFKVAIDACDVGVGEVLLQEDEEGIEKPVCYFSKKFNRFQMKYSTIEKEGLSLAIFWILLSVCMVIQMTNGSSSSSNLNDICPSVPPDMMEACPYTFSEHTHDMIKEIPKIVPLDHPDYHQLVPPQARGRTNLYCAHPACIPNPCLHGGSCQETFADFDCNCTAFYVGKRCEKRNTITDVKFLDTGSRQGVVSFKPIKEESPWEIMSFWGWESSTSDLICKYLGFPGAYSTVDGVVLNSLPESAILGAKVIVCPGDAMNITDCWLSDEVQLEGTGVVGVICCEDYECTSPGIPLGLENGDVIDTQITASSEDQTYKTATARLHGPQCWQPLIHDKLQWLQVDLLDAHLLTGLSMQGRVHEDYYVTAFTLKYSLIDTVWSVYKDELKQVKVIHLSSVYF
nr:uncharacterized protein LOC129263260 [Lytechinus pictus]